MTVLYPRQSDGFLRPTSRRTRPSCDARLRLRIIYKLNLSTSSSILITSSASLLYMMRSLNLASQDGRVLLEVGLKKPSDCLGYRTVIKCIERIADHGVLIAKR